MTTLRQAAEQIIAWYTEGPRPTGDDVVDTLREALDQLEQEPVAYRTVNNVGAYVYHSADRLPNEYGLRGEALYLHPAPILEGLQPNEWYWELVYADSCLDYIRENYPKIYQECGDDTEGSRKAMLRAAAPKPEEMKC